MTDQLRKALAQIEQLPEAAQNIAAEKLQTLAAELADQRWDELLTDPLSEHFFDEMEAEVQAAEAAGTLLPLPRTQHE
jgi:hypothetical protein